MSDIVIQVAGLRKSFRGKQVLKDVTFQVESGQTFAFLGRNGTGKTTTIRTLLGLLIPDSGTIRVQGFDPVTAPLEVRRRVGFLAEDQRMFPWMTVAELIRFVSAFYASWDHVLARQYIEQFDLPLKTRVKHLSKGQNVRLGLLLALAHRPMVVILDDPALGLDSIMRKEFNRHLITHLQGDGRTVLYSSHLLDEVEPVADVVGILHDGRIIRQVKTDELREQVKRLIIPLDALERLPDDVELLDLRRFADEIAVTVDRAAEAIESVQNANIPARVVDLNLDEIFEAIVNGCLELPPRLETAVAAV